MIRINRYRRLWPCFVAAGLAILTLGYFLSEPPVRAGGPIMLTGTANASPGSAFTWDLASLPGHSVQYRVDGGPLAATPSGTIVISNAVGITRVQGMFQTWQNVPTSAIKYNNAGPIQCPPGFCAGGDVQTVADFNAVAGTCNTGTQSPIIFDADGSLVLALAGDPAIIGFEGACDVDPVGGHFISGLTLLNGSFQNGVGPFQITANEFNQAFVHEFGHFSGLDHTQINVDVLNEQPLNCNPDEVAGLPVMFPIFICQDRVSSGLPPLAPDDLAWISQLYPVTTPAPAGKTLTASVYGTITGNVFFSDGVTPAQGVNVIARQVDDPSTPQNESLRNAVSNVSGYQFTGNPGQSVTCTVFDPMNPECNNNGSPNGSRDPKLIGVFNIPVPIPQGTASVSFNLQFESVNPGFAGGSSLNPLDPPIPNPGQDGTVGPVSVRAGQTVTMNITLQGTPPRFDSFETASLRGFDPPPVWDRKRLLSLSTVSG
jgi:hypothetical protein